MFHEQNLEAVWQGEPWTVPDRRGPLPHRPWAESMGTTPRNTWGVDAEVLPEQRRETVRC